MIESYTDHAANERTYLAWVRTALALLAFGLLLERFELFSRSISALADGAAEGSESALARVAGLALILLGVLTLAISSYRYLHFERMIASRERSEFQSSHTDLMLVAIVAVIALSMSVYVAARALV